jgi:Arc/MetJ family transcription regulator
MTTTLVLDENLISQAQKIGHHKTKKDAVTTALKEYIARKKQLEIVELFGKINFDNNYDYKKARTR